MKNLQMSFVLYATFLIFLTACSKSNKDKKLPEESPINKSEELDGARKDFKFPKGNSLNSFSISPLFTSLDSMVKLSGQKEIYLGKVERTISPYDVCDAFIGRGGNGESDIRISFRSTEKSPGSTFLLSKYGAVAYHEFNPQQKIYYNIPSAGMHGESEEKSTLPFHLALSLLRKKNAVVAQNISYTRPVSIEVFPLVKENYFDISVSFERNGELVRFNKTVDFYEFEELKKVSPDKFFVQTYRGEPKKMGFVVKKDTSIVWIEDGWGY